MVTKSENIKANHITENKTIKSKEETQNFSILSKIIEISLTIVPLMLYTSCYFFVQMTTLSFISRKFVDNQVSMISSFGIANLYMNISEFSITYSLLIGISGLASNSYGAKDYYLTGVYVHRGRIVAVTFVIFAGTINFFFGSSFLSLFVNDQKILKNIDIFIRIQVFTIFLEALSQTNVIYLSILDKGYINNIICVITTGLHFLWCFIFINLLNLGIFGAGISLLITQLLNFLPSSLYIHIFNPCPESYFCINNDCFKGLWDYLCYTFPTLLLMVSDYWSLEIESLIALYCSKLDFSSFVIVASIDSILYGINFGLNYGSTIIIGKVVTESTIEMVKKYFNLLMIIANIISISIIITCTIFAHQIIELLLTNKSDIALKSLSVKSFYISLLNFFFTNNVFVIVGTLRGLGKQILITIIFLLGNYPLKIPLALLIAKKFKYGVIGVWVSVVICNFVILIFYINYYWMLNLKRCKIEVEERLFYDQNQISQNKGN